jgi:hypothetical protein
VTAWEGEYQRSLVTEACKKSGLVWLSTRSGGVGVRPVATWHVWHDDAVHVVTGGIEQPKPGRLGPGPWLVTVRSKDTRARLVTFVADPSVVEPGTPAWDEAARALHAARLNAPDGEAEPERWGRESQILRLEPTGEVVELPATQSRSSGAAVPQGSPASTRPPLPFVVGPRAKRRKS